jgi:hypothetical protein
VTFFNECAGQYHDRIPGTRLYLSGLPHRLQSVPNVCAHDDPPVVALINW